MAVYERPYIIINGKSSEEITGLMICSLPPISKPAMRVSAEEIDGRDGDIVTELGFSAYDKEIEIGLYGEYDVNEIIEYFNQSGQIIFSNEPDKYYRFAIYNGIDFEKLIRFKRATVTFHVQPFKFDVVSNDAVFFSPSNVSITNEGNIYSRPEMAISGSGNVGISVNGSDVLEIELGETQQAIIIDSDGMNAYGTKSNIKNLVVDVKAEQDLHGYDHPWAGGAGKNKLNVSQENLEKPSYYPGTWTGTTIASGENAITVTRGNNSGGFGGVSIPNGLKSGIYTFSCKTSETNAGKIFYYGYAVNGEYQEQKIGLSTRGSNTNPQFTFELSDDTDGFYVKMAGADAESPITFSELQIEEGSTATSYEPYENICPITGHSGCVVTRTGANVCGGEFLANLIVSAFPSATKDTTNKTVSYTAVNANNRKLFDVFKPNTVYTFVIDTASEKTNLAVNYTDGTSMRLNVGVNITDSSKSIAYLRGQNQGQSTVLNYDNCGVFEGTITADDFQRYVGNPFTSFFEGLINGIYGYVDLGTLTWTYDSTNARFYATPNDMASNQAIACSKYPYVGGFGNAVDKSCFNIYNTKVGIKDSDYTDTTEFQTSLSGVYLIYQLATPTTPTITQAELDMLMTAFGIDEVSAIVVFGQEVFGATINITTGVLTVNKVVVDLSTLTWSTTSWGAYSASLSDSLNYFSGTLADAISEKYAITTYSNLNQNKPNSNFALYNKNVYVVADDSPTGQMVYPLDTPQTIQLTAQEIMTLIGENVLWADTGAINELIYTKDGVDITTSGDIVSFDVDAIDIKDNILKNRLVTGNYDGLRLIAGTNQIGVSGDVYVMVLSNFSRWL